jgi:hypothetical protein
LANLTAHAFSQSDEHLPAGPAGSLPNVFSVNDARAARAEQQPLPATILTTMMRTTAAHTTHNAVETLRTGHCAAPSSQADGAVAFGASRGRRSSQISVQEEVSGRGWLVLLSQKAAADPN